MTTSSRQSTTFDAVTRLAVLDVHGNAALTTLSFGALTGVFDRFLVRDNANLPQCQVTAVIAHLHGTDADVTTSGTGTGNCRGRATREWRRACWR